ncbi:MAG TPA: hypothetical protein VHQ92_11015 [Pseudolabrys sp.]|jgi:hypothetical protein|nr:hypothetical protein [Pseudolabrys sp.]
MSEPRSQADKDAIGSIVLARNALYSALDYASKAGYSDEIQAALADALGCLTHAYTAATAAKDSNDPT